MSKIRIVGEPVPMQRTEGDTGETYHLHSPEDPQARCAQGDRPPAGERQWGIYTASAHHDSPMQVALARAFYWQHLLDEGVVASGADIAKREGLHHSTVNELLRLTLLDPAIIQRILAGQQPRCMSLLWFQRNPLPLDWMEQREVVAQFDA